MSSKSVQLYVKVPSRPPTLLQRLENSLLECLVEYKPTDIDPRKVRVFDIGSAYQLKGSVMVIEDELFIQFAARNVGLHTARIFANTKEFCHPIAFQVSQSGEVVGLDSPTRQGGIDARRSYNAGTQSAVTTAMNSAASTVRAVESEHHIAFQLPPSSSLPNRPPSQPLDLSSHDNNFPLHEGDKTSMHTYTFNQFYAAKEGGQVIPGIPLTSYSRLSNSHKSDLTPEMFQSISKDAKITLGKTYGFKVKKRCDICSRKTKSSKCVRIWETDFCDSCCKTTFLQHSAIEHFMPPCVKECTIQVPLNKRGTKVSTTNKILPYVNLRGLDPSDLRNALIEFNKFDVEGDGWIERGILLPLMKACFTYSLPEPEIRALLISPSLKSMITNMGIDTREKVHQIEFLSLVAFIARERQRVSHDMITQSKFTHNDLAMAYAFERQYGGPQRKVPSSYHITNPPMMDGIRKSFTDSPLSQYQPAIMRESQIESPLYPHSDEPTSTLQQDNPDSQTSETAHEGGKEGSELEQPLVPTTTPPKVIPGQGKHKSKQMQMEEMKLTDTGADAWMMY